MRSISRRLGAVLASVVTAATLLATPAVAQVDDLSSRVGVPQVSVPQVGSSQQDLQDAAWNARNQIHQQTRVLDPQSSNAVRGAIDAALEATYPGLINQRTEAARPQPASLPQPASVPQLASKPSFDYGTCPADAKVCVDIDGRRTWLQNNGELYYGPVYHAPGKPGEDTPRGTFWVNRKVKDEISYEFNNAPMPYAVYFTYNGHAFHQGNTSYDSAGCVRLDPQHAQKYFNDLHIGDKVFIY